MALGLAVQPRVLVTLAPFPHSDIWEKMVQPRHAWERLDSDVLAWSTRDGKQLRVFLSQLTEVRRIVEPDAARLAAMRATPDDLEELQGTRLLTM